MTELQTDIRCPECGAYLWVGAAIDYDPTGARYLERWIECRAADCKHWTDTDPLWKLDGIEAWLKKAEQMFHATT